MLRLSAFEVLGVHGFGGLDGSFFCVCVCVIFFCFSGGGGVGVWGCRAVSLDCKLPEGMAEGFSAEVLGMI